MNEDMKYIYIIYIVCTHACVIVYFVNVFHTLWKRNNKNKKKKVQMPPTLSDSAHNSNRIRSFLPWLLCSLSRNWLSLLRLLTVSQNTYDNVQTHINLSLSLHSMIILCANIGYPKKPKPSHAHFPNSLFRLAQTKADTFGLKLKSSLINYFYIQILFHIQSKLSKIYTNIYMFTSFGALELWIPIGTFSFDVMRNVLIFPKHIYSSII